MCLALIGLHKHPRYPLIIAANRDEFHSRPALAAHWWASGALAGKDMSGGGTWFGVGATGRWALITNFREGSPRDPNAPSRGHLVTDALADRRRPLVAAASMAINGWQYHGFNLLIGDVDEAAYTSNRASGALALSSGTFGVANHLLDTPWSKVVRGKASFSDWLAHDDPPLDAGFALLNDRRGSDDDALPATGVSRERERLLSAPFVVSPDYGTRCSTLLMIGSDRTARFAERRFDAAGVISGETRHEFELKRSDTAGLVTRADTGSPASPVSDRR